VEVNSSDIRVTQRFYDSYGLPSGHGANPERTVAETFVPYTGKLRLLTVVLDAHLGLDVYANGELITRQNCLIDVSRHQLQFSGPHSKHLALSGMLLQPEAASATVMIDPSKRHQEILGFGGSPSIPAYNSLSEEGKRQYWDTLKRYNLLIDREYPMGTRLKPDMSNLDNAADASPHYYGDNFPNGELTSFPYNAESKRLGGKLIYEQWALPGWETKDFTDSEGKIHKGAADPAEWARAILEYVRTNKERTGYLPDVIGIQNEVSQPREITYQMVRTLRSELDKAGYKSIKIHMPDASYVWVGKDVANTLSADPDVWSKIDIAATHEYDFQQHFTDPDTFDPELSALHDAERGKPYLATEICVNDTRLQISSYRVAFQVGQLYHKNMTMLDAIGLLYCWLILDVEEPNFGASRSLLVPDRSHGNLPVPSSYQLRILGAYSRHLHEGMVRVDATSSDKDLLVSAYEGPQGQRTVILTNRSTRTISLVAPWQGTRWKEMEMVSQYRENDVLTPSLNIALQPGEIVIFSTVAVESLSY
jgi:O-glycosyl hydrolase